MFNTSQWHSSLACAVTSRTILALLLHRPDDNSGAAEPGCQGAVHPAVPPAGRRRLHRCGAAGQRSGAVQPRPHPRQAAAADLHSRHHPRLGASFNDLCTHRTDLSSCVHGSSNSIRCSGTSAACPSSALHSVHIAGCHSMYVSRARVKQRCCQMTGHSVWGDRQRHPVSRHAGVHELAVCD